MKSFFTIRFQLLALVLAIALPMIGILLFTIYDNAQQRIIDVRSQAHLLAVSAASDVTRVLDSNREFLKQMAKRPLIRKMDSKHCDQVLWDFHELLPKSANMTVVDINGTAICSAVPQPGGKPVSVAKAPWFKKSLAMDDFVVSDPFFGPITGRWVTVLTYPIRDDHGTKIGFLGLPLDLALYKPNLSNVPLIPNITIGIVTGNGTFVWRNIDTEKWVGKTISDKKTLHSILQGLEGEMAGLDSKNKLYHIHKIDDIDWTVYIGIPSSYINEQLYATLYRNLFLGVLGLVLILTFAWWIAQKISRPIGSLAFTSRAVRTGNKEIRAQLDGPPEIVEVAREFNDMLNVRFQAEAALLESEVKLSEALEIARLGHWEYDVGKGEFTFNDQYYSLHHTNAEEMGGYQMSSAYFAQHLVYPDDAKLVGIAIAEAINTTDPDFIYQTEARIVCTDGEVRWVQVRLKIEKNSQGITTRLIGANQDITERKNAELTQKRLNRSLRLLSECNMTLVHAVEESQLLSEICQLVVEEGGYLMACVSFAEHDAEKSIKTVALYGNYQECLEQTVFSWADTEYGHGATGTAIRTGRTDIVQSIMDDPRMTIWREVAASRGYRSCVALPLKTKSHIFGALSIYAGEANIFGEEEVELLDELANDLAYGIETLRTRIRHLEAEKKLEFLAHHDVLTGLPNRLLLRDRFEQAIAQANREHSGVAVIFLDLDNFKEVNDTLGHSYGDQLLVKVVERLRRCLRDSDTISRQGGDEFVVLLPLLNDLAVISGIAQHIVETFSDPFEINGYTVNTTFSIGVSLYPDDGKEFDTLLSNADTAMYQAKDSGRDTYRFFSEKMNIDAQEQLQLQGQLRHAVKNQEFVLYYQPQVDIASGRLVGAEALVRWQHPLQGLIPPAKFISLAERSGLIVPMGDWVLNEACNQAQKWRDNGHNLVIAVNLSALQFKRGNLLDTVAHALKRSGLPAEMLELELTESILLQDVDAAIRMLHKLKSMGVKLSIDDFGTGYSSLSYLKRLAVNKLKVDQSFVRDLTEDSDSAAIVRAIVQLGHTLQLTVIAEGVETEEQLAFLRKHGCDEAQGYLYSRPVPANEFVAFFERIGK